MPLKAERVFLQEKRVFFFDLSTTVNLSYFLTDWIENSSAWWSWPCGLRFISDQIQRNVYPSREDFISVVNHRGQQGNLLSQWSGLYRDKFRKNTYMYTPYVVLKGSTVYKCKLLLLLFCNKTIKKKCYLALTEHMDWSCLELRDEACSELVKYRHLVELLNGLDWWWARAAF